MMFLVRSLHSVTGDFPASHVWLPEGSIKPLSSISCWRVVSCGLSGFAAFYSRYVWEREEHGFQRGTRDWSSCMLCTLVRICTNYIYISLSLSLFCVVLCFRQFDCYYFRTLLTQMLNGWTMFYLYCCFPKKIIIRS